VIIITILLNIGHHIIIIATMVVQTNTDITGSVTIRATTIAAIMVSQVQILLLV
jgi:hypothetical protein